MKRRFPISRVFAVSLLAVGAGVALLASREDGRARLVKSGEFIGQAGEYVGMLVGAGVEYAGQWIEERQAREAPTMALPFTPTYQNGAAPREEHLIGAR